MLNPKIIHIVVGICDQVRRQVGYLEISSGMAQLKMDHPLLVIAIGAAEPVCREMMMEGKDRSSTAPRDKS